MSVKAQFIAGSLALAAAHEMTPITTTKLGVIDDLTRGSLGHNQSFTAQTVELLGLHADTGRQVSLNYDNVHIHFFNRFASDPGVIVLLYQDGAVLHAYKTDNKLQFVRGYIGNNGRYDVISTSEGDASAKAEFAWWSKSVSDLIEDARKALAAGKSSAKVATAYGVSAQTLDQWLAGATQR
jgi:hypothetical protein